MMTMMLFAGMLLMAGVIAAGVRRVPAQRVLTVRRFGRYRRTLGPGWHWLLPVCERAGGQVSLIGHHLHVRAADSHSAAELYYQIMEPEKAGETLDCVDAWVARQTEEALQEVGTTPNQLQCELNRRVAPLGLRVIRCALHVV